MNSLGNHFDETYLHASVSQSFSNRLGADMDEARRRMLTSVNQPGGAVAQLGARLDGIEEVVGSNPIGSTIHTQLFQPD
jgi:hypothetical protein